MTVVVKLVRRHLLFPTRHVQFRQIPRCFAQCECRGGAPSTQETRVDWDALGNGEYASGRFHSAEHLPRRMARWITFARGLELVDWDEDVNSVLIFCAPFLFLFHACNIYTILPIWLC